MAQGGADATAVRAILVTPTPEGAQAFAPTITPSFTPSPLPAARLQALQTAGNVNVRALPDIESDLLGTIAHGTLYPALRNYYRWYELRFDLSPIRSKRFTDFGKFGSQLTTRPAGSGRLTSTFTNT